MSFCGKAEDNLIDFLLDCILFSYDEGCISSEDSILLYRFVRRLICSDLIISSEFFDKCFKSYIDCFNGDIPVGYLEPHSDSKYTVAPSPSGNEDNINNS